MKSLAKRLLGSRWLKVAVVVIAVGIGVYEIDKEWNQVHHALAEIGLLASFEALLALLVMQYATLRQWQSLLAGLGSPLRTTTAGRIFFIGQLGKYIPGSLWPVLTQMELGARANVPRARSASASILTMILSLATGLIVAAATLPFAHYSAGYDWVFVLVPVILVCLYPRVLNPLLNWLFKLIKRPGLDQPVTLTMMSKAIAWSFLAWLANGVQIWVLAEKLGASGSRTILIALGGYAFAWCVGFVIVFAPAGAGARDALLILALSPLIGKEPALAVALVSRAVNTISDLLVAGLAAASRRRGQNAAVGAAEGPAAEENELAEDADEKNAVEEKFKRQSHSRPSLASNPSQTPAGSGNSRLGFRAGLVAGSRPPPSRYTRLKGFARKTAGQGHNEDRMSASPAKVGDPRVGGAVGSGKQRLGTRARPDRGEGAV